MVKFMGDLLWNSPLRKIVWWILKVSSQKFAVCDMSSHCIMRPMIYYVYMYIRWTMNIDVSHDFILLVEF